ncbi:hypothetical protein [Streptomyces sp. TLI_171]|uniref:hypothetical protein n=1 Tax=Streptomyces sp. TLI_171 TaxID=1938859 RepID=UPI000C17D844|nr:hypothetical protein [Streptomyces sp. TLI_171]RKE20477.1 hypothetical protein BX266_3840 [Streptomyces sp. TLI_171]
MTSRTRTACALGALALAAALLTGCTGTGDAPEPDAPSVSPVALPAPRQAPAPAAVLATPVATGEVRVENGPFTDRIRLTGLALTATPAVTGHLTVTSDVSDVLALEVHAAYYDAAGHLLGTGTFQYQEEEAATGQHAGPRAAGEGIDLTVPADHLTGTPTGAVLTVPVLVNE